MKSLLENIKNNWGVIIFIVGMIIWYADTNSRLTYVEAQTKDNTSSIKEFGTIKNDIGVIKNDVSWIKDKLK